MTVNVWIPKAAATSGEIAKTATRVMRMSDCTNANVRPRTSSLTSMPSIVKPVTQVMPANAPRNIVIRIETVKFGIAASNTRKKPATANDAPNKRRRENCANTFGPTAIPSAKPEKTAPKSTPYAASPPPRSPTNVRARPITAPAAEKAPTIPMMRPRMIFDSPTVRHPCISACSTPSCACFSEGVALGISFRFQIVTAAKRKLAALR